MGLVYEQPTYNADDRRIRRALAGGIALTLVSSLCSWGPLIALTLAMQGPNALRRAEVGETIASNKPELEYYSFVIQGGMGLLIWIGALVFLGFAALEGRGIKRNVAIVALIANLLLLVYSLAVMNDHVHVVDLV